METHHISNLNLRADISVIYIECLDNSIKCLGLTHNLAWIMYGGGVIGIVAVAIALIMARQRGPRSHHLNADVSIVSICH